MYSTPGLKDFNPKNPKHVIWLKELSSILENMDMSMGHKMNALLKKNPFNVEIPAEAFIDVHAGISIKYCTAVLKGEAFIP